MVALTWGIKMLNWMVSCCLDSHRILCCKGPGDGAFGWNRRATLKLPAFHLFWHCMVRWSVSQEGTTVPIKPFRVGYQLITASPLAAFRLFPLPSLTKKLNSH